MRIDPSGNHDHLSNRTPVVKETDTARAEAAKPKEPALLAGPEKRAEAKPLQHGQGKTLDLRSFTPRQMAELSMELYVAGVVTWDEYAMLAFQPELHPDYDRTIGALTGEKAAPDRPRDFVAEWETRLSFEEKHNGKDREAVQRTVRIVNVLKQLGAPTNVLV